MHLLEDIRAYKKNDPAARSAIEVMLLYNGLHATIDYRIAHWFYLRRCFFIARAISQWSKMWTGIEIHPGATIGRRLVIDHGTGIVIGETAEIGDDCLLYQGVTLGGTGKDIGKRHPTLGNNVMVGSGAKVLGPFRVGDNARIAANAVVLREVPEERTNHIHIIFKVNYSRPPPNALYRLITACIRWKVSDTSFNWALSNDCCAVMISR